MLMSRLVNVTFNLMLILLSIVCIAPLLVVISTSFTSEQSLVLDGYQLLPREFTTYAYRYVLKGTTLIYTSYGVTLFTTLFGTLTSLLLTALLAYPMSRKGFRF